MHKGQSGQSQVQFSWLKSFEEKKHVQGDDDAAFDRLYVLVAEVAEVFAEFLPIEGGELVAQGVAVSREAPDASGQEDRRVAPSGLGAAAGDGNDLKGLPRRGQIETVAADDQRRARSPLLAARAWSERDHPEFATLHSVRLQTSSPASSNSGSRS